MLGPALEWADWLGTPGRSNGSEGEATEVEVLHIARDPDKMYAGSARLGDQMEHYVESTFSATLPRPLQCIRFGASDDRRVARRIAQPGADLLILQQPGTGEGTAATDVSWLSILVSAGCSALVLPPVSVASGPGMAGHGDG